MRNTSRTCPVFTHCPANPSKRKEYLSDYGLDDEAFPGTTWRDLKNLYFPADRTKAASCVRGDPNLGGAWGVSKKIPPKIFNV